MTVEEILAALEEMFGAKREMQDKWGVTAIVPATYLHNAVQYLKEQSGIKFEMLVDIAGIDYLTYPNHEGPRFAVAYAFKSMSTPGSRIRLKVLVSEESLKVPTKSASKNLATRSCSAVRKWKRTTTNFWKGVSRNDRIRSEWRKAEFDALERGA